MLRFFFAAALAAGLGSALAHAGAPRVDSSAEAKFRTQVEQLAADYDLLLQVDDFARLHGYDANGNPFSRIADACENQEERAGGGCIQSLCKLTGELDCRAPADVLRAGRACRGNAGGGCVRKACGLLAGNECWEFKALTNITASCRGVNNLGCVDHVCHKLGSEACDMPAEVTLVLEACR